MTTATAAKSGSGFGTILLLLVATLALPLLATPMMAGLEAPAAPAGAQAAGRSLSAFLVEMDDAHRYDPAVDVGAPVAGPIQLPTLTGVGEHALSKHSEAAMIWQAFKGGPDHYICLEVFVSLRANRIMWRLTLNGTSLQGAIITTVAGVPRTAMLAPPAYWDTALDRYGYIRTPVLRLGKCAQAAK